MNDNSFTGRFIIWCRWSKAAGDVPDERDREWNLVTKIKGRNDCLWGYDTLDEAIVAANNFKANWQPNMMQTYIDAVFIPA